MWQQNDARGRFSLFTGIFLSNFFLSFALPPLQEVDKLRDENLKQSRKLRNLESKTEGAKRRFNPTDAFKNTKENSKPLTDHN